MQILTSFSPASYNCLSLFHCSQPYAVMCAGAGLIARAFPLEHAHLAIRAHRLNRTRTVFAGVLTCSAHGFPFRLVRAGLLFKLVAEGIAVLVFPNTMTG